MKANIKREKQHESESEFSTGVESLGKFRSERLAIDFPDSMRL